jgi:hypothetical protein
VTRTEEKLCLKEENKMKWEGWILLMRRVCNAVEYGRSLLDPELFAQKGSARPLHFVLRYQERSPRSFTEERVKHMMMGLCFYTHGAYVYHFNPDEQIISDIKHLITLEDRDLEDRALGVCR